MVGTRCLLDEEHCSGMSVHLRTEGVRLGSKLHVGYVSQAQNLTVGGGTQDDFTKLAHFTELSLELNIHLVNRALDTTHGRHQMLFIDGIDNLLPGDAV